MTNITILFKIRSRLREAVVVKLAKAGILLMYASGQQQTQIHLIDGVALVRYMVRYKASMAPIANFKVYQVDENYFSD